MTAPKLDRRQLLKLEAAAIAATAAGMPVTIQCTNVRCGASGFGASGSSTRIAIERVPGGGGDHASGGGMSSPSAVNCTGMAAPCANADDVTVKLVDAMVKASAGRVAVIRARSHYFFF